MMPRQLLLLLLIPACYDAPPPQIPRIDAPAVVPGELLDISTTVRDERRRVTDHDRVCVGSSCSTVSVSHHEMVAVKHATASYDGKDITFGQAQALADPTFVTDAQRMETARAQCKRAAIPRYIGEITTLVGLLYLIQGTATTSGDIDAQSVAIGGTAMGVGIVSYALGRYVFGGQHCSEANEIYEARRTEWHASQETDVEDGLADELELIGQKFNAARAATGAK